MNQTAITSRVKDKVSIVKASRGRPIMGGGYSASPAMISVHSAGAAVYLDIDSDSSQRVELALNSEETMDLISALHEHLKNHASSQKEFRSALDRLEV